VAEGDRNLVSAILSELAFQVRGRLMTHRIWRDFQASAGTQGREVRIEAAGAPLDGHRHAAIQGSEEGRALKAVTVNRDVPHWLPAILCHFRTGDADFDQDATIGPVSPDHLDTGFELGWSAS
jgi:hypothetical protein